MIAVLVGGPFDGQRDELEQLIGEPPAEVFAYLCPDCKVAHVLVPTPTRLERLAACGLDSTSYYLDDAIDERHYRYVVGGIELPGSDREHVETQEPIAA